MRMSSRHTAFAFGLASVLTMACESALPGVGIDDDDIGGVVTSENGAEAGVWVIAEANYEVCPHRGHRRSGSYVVPDLPEASCELWVRGFRAG